MMGGDSSEGDLMDFDFSAPKKTSAPIQKIEAVVEIKPNVKEIKLEDIKLI